MNQEMLELLFKLQEMPMAPAKKIAEEIGKSTPTVITWLAKLAEDRVYLGVKPYLRAHRLGLELYDYLLEIKSYKDLIKIEKFCEEHPYTAYRSRVFGGEHRGMLVQFRQPPETLIHLESAFERMREKGIVQSVRELPTLQEIYGSIHTRPQLGAWDPERMTWNFDWERWWSQEPQREQDRSATRPKKNEVATEHFEIDHLDAKILQELTDNARQKNIDIIKKIGLNPREGSIQQKISKRILRLQEVIDSFRVFINWTHFDVYNTPMLIVKAERTKTERLIAKLQEGTFPFSSSIRQIPDGFVWYARLPSAHFSELLSFIWQLAKDYELLIIDYKHSQTYGLWAETFDAQTGDWKTDEKFCLEQPLKSIGL
ncbi:MAG: hypothetical protein K9W43_01370 [Candidatus Thorarchaeota archaeon]|nr:hypothetical protein [Candidatus Thorarchaeota archaeon]